MLLCCSRLSLLPTTSSANNQGASLLLKTVTTASNSYQGLLAIMALPKTRVVPPTNHPTSPHNVHHPSVTKVILCCSRLLWLSVTPTMPYWQSWPSLTTKAIPPIDCPTSPHSIGKHTRITFLGQKVYQHARATTQQLRSISSLRWIRKPSSSQYPQIKCPPIWQGSNTSSQHNISSF